MIFIACSSARAERQERHLSRVLDRRGHVALVLRAVAGDAARTDLAPVGHELLQQPHVLEVDIVDLVLAEDADLALLLLLPALVVLLLADSFPAAAAALSRHPGVSPLLHRRPRPRAPSPSRPRRRRSGPASPPWPWPTGATGRSRRPRSRPRSACRPPGSPRNAAA